MLTHKGIFYRGVILLVAFIVVLVAIFSPLFNGQNGLEFLDALYNSISKGSAYYIPAVKEETAAFQGVKVDVALEMAAPDTAKRTAALFMKSGALVNVSGNNVKISGDLGRIRPPVRCCKALKSPPQLLAPPPQVLPEVSVGAVIEMLLSFSRRASQPQSLPVISS